jgi:hypothetical protein
VNTQKSKVLVFNSNKETEAITYKGEVLEQLREFKYLGMIFNRDGSMKHADSQWAGALIGAGNRVMQMAAEFGVRHRIDLVLNLYKAYAVSVGMYAAQIWSTPFLQHKTALDSEVQTNHIHMLRYLVKARRGTCRRSLLHELGQRPFQFHWWRSTANFWNKMMGSNSGLLKAVARSDRDLALAGCKSSWVWQVREGMESMGITEVTKLMGLQSIDCRGLMSQVEEKQSEFWRQLSGIEEIRQEGVEHRKSRSFDKWFRLGTDPKVPKYFSIAEVSYQEAIRVARFRLGSHFLGVASFFFANIPWEQRKCTRCSAGYLASVESKCGVDDEYHMLFECEAFAHLRGERLMMIPSDLTNRNLVDFSDWRVCKFVSSCMELLDDGGMAL